MAVGSLLFRLVRANAVVTVEVGTASASGGTVLTWSTLKAGVDVIVSRASGGRDFNSGVYNERLTCTVTGRDPEMGRPDVRLRVTAAAKGMTWMVGRYIAVNNAVTYARGGAGLVQERVTVSGTILEVPADTGSEL